MKRPSTPTRWPRPHGPYAYSALAAGLLAWCAPEQALAYRTAADLDEIGNAAHWSPATIPVEIDRRFGSWSRDQSRSVVARAFGAWETTDCDTPHVRAGETAPNDASYGDGRNTIEWIPTGWAARGFAPDAGAVTELRYSRQGDLWEIVEFDIYVNAERYTWSLDLEPPPGQRSLLAVLTHEAGHALGLLHPCEDDGASGAPMCTATDALAVMHPENGTRVELGADDIAGLCTLYPPATCDEVSCEAPLLCREGRCVDPCDGVTCANGTRCDLGTCVPCAPLGCGLSCATDLDCTETERCVDATCRPRLGSTGDPCAVSTDCGSGECDSLGHCTQVCGSGSPCPSGWECDDSEARCIPRGGVLGSACDEGDECTSGLCLVREGAGQCTRECGDGCPVGLTCTPVNGRNVCAAPRTAGNCSVQPNSASAPYSTLALLLAFSVMRAFRRNRLGR